jgi:hypothetical protein
MNRARRYFPGFVDTRGIDIPEQDFETLEELLAIEWVHSWTKNEESSSKFYRFSKSDRMLFAELIEEDGSRIWWGVAHIKYPDLLDLPTLNTTK